MEKKVLVPIAHGTEEMEAVIIIDMLRRAGLNVKVAGENQIITCSRGVKIIPDCLLENLDSEEEFDAIVLPGGLGGVENLKKNGALQDLLINQNNRKGLIAAICAAPTILSAYKIIKPNYGITSHPSVKNQLIGFDYKNENVVLFDNILTGRGAGTAIEFSLWLIDLLAGSSSAESVATAIVLV